MRYDHEKFPLDFYMHLLEHAWSKNDLNRVEEIIRDAIVEGGQIGRRDPDIIKQLMKLSDECVGRNRKSTARLLRKLASQLERAGDGNVQVQARRFV